MMEMLDTEMEGGHEKEEVDADEQITLASDEPTYVIAADAVDEQAAAIASVTGAGNLTIDPMQFQLRADGGGQGQVTYRVVQMPSESGEGTTQVIAGNFASNQVTVIQSPFSNGESPSPEQQGEPRFAYFTGATADGAGVSPQADTITAATALAPVGAGASQFYVMMSPHDVLQNTQRTIAPRTSYSPKMEGRSTRDDRRRATHNEVERRRRDKINNWIVQLSKIIPDCAQETVKPNQASKGGILSKACEYIVELRNSNKSLSEGFKEGERASVDNEILRSQVEELKKQNESLRTLLITSGVSIPHTLATNVL